MSDEPLRRGSDWERKEELVLQTLEDLRLSADSSLKAVNEIKIDMAHKDAKDDGRFQALEAQYIDLKGRVDKATAALITLSCGVILFLFQQFFTYMLTHSVPVLNAVTATLTSTK